MTAVSGSERKEKLAYGKPKGMTDSQKRAARKRYLITCIALAELSLEKAVAAGGNEDCDTAAMTQLSSGISEDENVGSGSVSANVALLEGLLGLMEEDKDGLGATSVPDSTKHRMVDDIVADCGAKPVYEILNAAYNAVSSGDVNGDDGATLHLGLVCIGRLLLLEPVSSPVATGAAAADPDVRDFAFKSLVVEAGTLLAHFYDSLVDALFRFQLPVRHHSISDVIGPSTCSISDVIGGCESVTAAGAHLPTLSLTFLQEWSSFYPLRMAFIASVAERVQLINEAEDSMESVCQVVQVAKTLANRLNVELLPPAAATKPGQKKIKRSFEKAVTSSATESGDGGGGQLDVRSNLPAEIAALGAAAAGRVEVKCQKSYATFRRAAKKRLMDQLDLVRGHLTAATLGKSISQPEFCTAVFELEVAIDVLVEGLGF